MIKYNKTDVCVECNKRPLRCKGLCKICYGKYRRRKVQAEAPLKKCECSEECQEMIPSIDQNGNFMRYKQYHGPKGEKSKKLKYFKNHVDGYILEYCGDHPFADKAGYVLQHRLVYERYYNVCLLPWTEIHHKDGNKKNNNKISNLIPVTKSNHSIITMLERKGIKIKDLEELNKPKICIYPNCKNPDRTFIDIKGKENWFIWNNGYICRNCYYKEQRRSKIIVK